MGALPPNPRKVFAPFDPLTAEPDAQARPVQQLGIKSRNLLRWLGWKPVLALPVVFLAVFFFYPLVAIFGVSLTDEAGALDLSGFGEILTSAYYRETLWFTVWQAALSTALTLAAAIPAAFVFTRYMFRGKKLMMSLATLPFVLPTVVVAAAFDALLGEQGVVNSLLVGLFRLDAAPVQLERTLTLVLIAHVFYNVAVALRMITGYWANQSPRIEEAARVLGVSGWQLWTRVRLPLLRPAITAAAMLVFIFTFTSFGVVLILGGPQYATLEVEIERQARSLFNLPVAAALSMVQIGVMFAMMIVYTRLQQRISVPVQTRALVERRPQNAREHAAVAATIGGLSLLLFVPLGALVYRAFTTAGGIENFARLSSNPRGSILFVPPLTAVGNSVLFALVTMVLAVTLGVLTAALIESRRGKWLDALFMLPLATSAVTLGFGYLIAMSRPPLNLRSSAVLIPLAHTLVALPFVVRSVLPALRMIPRSIVEAARVLGEPPSGVWRRVTLPIVGRAVVVGATFAFTVSMGEFGASLFIARPDTPTMPVVIFRLLGQPGASNYGQALAMSVILMAVCAVAFVTIERLRVGGVGEF
jgi:thiamine transport system permease protein